MSNPIVWNNSPIEGIIFDMDGVIADTREAHKKSWLEFANREGWQIDPDEFILRTFGRGNMQIMPAYYPRNGRDRDFIARKSEEKEALYRALVRAGEVDLLPGVGDFLNIVAERGLPVSLGSSAPRGNVDCTLEVFQLRHHFPVIVGMEDVSHAKPDPEIFLNCAEQMRVPAEHCLVLEDSIHGLEAARNAGSRAIGITSMHTVAELAPLCEATAADFHTVIQLLGLGR